MSLIRPQGNNRRFKKKAIKLIALEGMTDIFDYISADGKTPCYFLLDPGDKEVCYFDVKPFTLEQARKEHEEVEEE